MKPARLCRTALLAVGPYLAVVACSGSRPVPSEPPPTTPPAEPSVEKKPEARPVFSNCYLGNSEFEFSSCQEGPSGGHRCPPPSEPTCTINASCIARLEVTTPGEGSVYMDCKEGRCTCNLRAHAPPETVVEFEFAASCSSRDVMRQLIREHCLAGMEVLPRSGEPGEAPSEK